MRKIIRNKKGSGALGAFLLPQKAIYYVFLLIFFAAIILGVVVVVNQLYQSKIVLQDTIKSDFALSRITNVCFAHTDQITGNIQPNIIDQTKITKSRLEACFKTDRKPTFSILVRPVFKNDFESKKVGFSDQSTLNFGATNLNYDFEKYVLLRLPSGELKPALIYYIP